MISDNLRKLRLTRATQRTARAAQASSAAKSDLPDIAAKADDLSDIKKAVEDAAAVSGGLWLSYLFVLFYLAIAAGAVTHTDLLMENPVKLPFLNIELPLCAFFLLAPFLFVITHAYALVHFKMLGLKTLRFHDELHRQLPDGAYTDRPSAKDLRDKLRRLLPSNIFVQIFAGPPETRDGLFGTILWSITGATLVLFPVLLLLFFQIQFLPYHGAAITWTQRIALLLDVVLLWILRPPTLAGGVGGWSLDGGEGNKTRKRVSIVRAFAVLFVGLLSFAAFWLSFAIATIPGEWQETALPWLDPPLWWSTGDDTAEVRKRFISTRAFLFTGTIDETTRRRTSLFSNTLVLPGFNLLEALKLDDPKKAAQKETLIDLRGRHLEKIMLDDAALNKADLTGAHLEGAGLNHTKLQGATLDKVYLNGASATYAEFEGAALKKAQLQGAYLIFTHFEGASLAGAQFQGADLTNAKLQGALLRDAALQGSTLRNTNLQGAYLAEAHLQGALLKDAELQGAFLKNAELDGASFVGANMTAADLSHAHLWRSQWQSKAPFQFDEVFCESARRPASLEISAKPADVIRHRNDAYEDLRKSLGRITAGPLRDAALRKAERLNCHHLDGALPSCDPAAVMQPNVTNWETALEHASIKDLATYQKNLAKSLQRLVCTTDHDAVYILRGLIRDSDILITADYRTVPITRLSATGPEAAKLIDFIESKDCPTSSLLTEDDKTKLRALRDRFPPPAEK